MNTEQNDGSLLLRISAPKLRVAQTKPEKGSSGSHPDSQTVLLGTLGEESRCEKTYQGTQGKSSRRLDLEVDSTPIFLNKCIANSIPRELNATLLCGLEKLGVQLPYFPGYS